MTTINIMLLENNRNIFTSRDNKPFVGPPAVPFWAKQISYFVYFFLIHSRLKQLRTLKD